MTITAETIADSISAAGHRLTTQVIRFPRSIDRQVLTHRAFARNARSSRATPVNHMIDEVLRDPYIPVKWQRAQRGMQGGEEFTAEEAKVMVTVWLTARDDAVTAARQLLGMGMHKTVPNRLLEPFAHQTMIISGTDAAWVNFFIQRCEDDVDPPMQILARTMRAAYIDSRPVEVSHGYTGWHLPFIDAADRQELGPRDQARVSAARCARVSNLTFDGRRSTEDDLRLYHDVLMAADPPHSSPLEHPAQVASIFDHPAGCFDGWHQLRHLPALR